MSAVDEALVARLLAWPALTALIGTRVRPAFRAQGTDLPAVTYQRIDDEEVTSHDGASGLVGALYQVDAWAARKADVTAIDREVRAALAGFRGTVAGVAIGGILPEGTREEYDGDLGVWRISRDLRVWYWEQ